MNYLPCQRDKSTFRTGEKQSVFLAHRGGALDSEESDSRRAA
jgi:hypothetical protein